MLSGFEKKDDDEETGFPSIFQEGTGKSLTDMQLQLVKNLEGSEWCLINTYRLNLLFVIIKLIFEGINIYCFMFKCTWSMCCFFIGAFLMWLIEMCLLIATMRSCKSKEDGKIGTYLGWYSFFYILELIFAYKAYTANKIFWPQGFFINIGVSIAIWLLYITIFYKFSKKIKNLITQGCIEDYKFGAKYTE